MAKSLGFCRQCSRAIDPRSKTCPHCGISQPVRQRTFLKPVLWLLAALAVGYAVVLFGPTDTPRAPDSAEDRRPAAVTRDATRETVAPPQVNRKSAEAYDSRARAAARDYVREQLESPDTAVFSGGDETQAGPLEGGPPNQWLVKGYVDSTDIVSGAVARKRYEVVVEFEDGRPDSVRMVSAVIN